MVEAVAAWLKESVALGDRPPTYWYEGRCPHQGEELRLPRTPLVEAIARHLMQVLAHDERYNREGKMYGVLLVEQPSGQWGVLKAFSGLLNRQRQVAGWVPPIPGHDAVALAEAQTLAELEAIKQELIRLEALPERQQYAALSQTFEQQLREISDRNRQRKQDRQLKRQALMATLSGDALTAALDALEAESRWDGIERRHLKRRQNEALQALKPLVDAAESQIHHLKQQRKRLSHRLQAQMRMAYCLTNFAGQSLSLQALMAGQAMPTGTGDCCAPKLLHYAAVHGLKPLAMAEFWWGPPSSSGDKVPGEFYGACAERCQPLMGFLLSGLSHQWTKADAANQTALTLPLLYEDEWLLAVEKPAGLLSVPGRYRDRQDSVFSRLQHQCSDGLELRVVHRLDQDTSGILLMARDRETHRQLSLQFRQRQVQKVYEAVLAGAVAVERGETGLIDLPLWSDPSDRPYQRVDQRGKPSQTHFQILTHSQTQTRVEFRPITGRTHQLRVHAASPQGLGVPILGDRLYGCPTTDRLHLHARELSFKHPHSGQPIHLQTQTPF